MRLDASNPNFNWKVATKTKAIKAKPINQIICDSKGFEILLLKTLEGLQEPKEGSIVCIGLDIGEPWQQSQDKLFQKYSVVEVDVNGWLMCEPKPDNARDGVQVTEDMCEDGKFYINAAWGEPQEDGTHRQYGVAGDYLFRVQEDHTDVYVLRQQEFDATYEWVKEGSSVETVTT